MKARDMVAYNQLMDESTLGRYFAKFLRNNVAIREIERNASHVQYEAIDINGNRKYWSTSVGRKADLKIQKQMRKLNKRYPDMAVAKGDPTPMFSRNSPPTDSTESESIEFDNAIESVVEREHKKVMSLYTKMIPFLMFGLLIMTLIIKNG